MMEVLKRYSKYKMSNISWLKEIPEHWQNTRLKFLSRITTGNKNTEDKKQNGVYNFYVRSQKIEKIDSYSFEGEGILTAGDGVGVGKVFHYVNERFDFHQRVYLFYNFPSIVNGKYLFYFLKSFLIIDLKLFNAKSTVDSVRLPTLKDFVVPLPPKKEQTAIVRFLDYKLAKINRFIQKKKQLIKLLNEQKVAIINQAVTKGLDPNAKMKDSGIEWLGEIPEHWEVRKLKYVAKICNGSECDKQDEGLYPVYGSGGIFGYYSDFLYDKPSVLLGRKGTINKPIFVDSPFWTVDTAFYTKIKDEIVLPYFFFLACTTINFDFYSTKTALPSMTQTSLYDVKIALPPISEQKQIISFIEKETTIINTTISKIEKELALTEEYKTALIAEAVTGKIDVRGYEVPEISEEETYEEIEEELGMVAEEQETYETE